MPYRLSDNGKCVEKQNESGKWTTLKCHQDHADALAHLRALEVNVSDAFREWTRSGKASPEMARAKTAYLYEPIKVDGETSINARKDWGEFHALVVPYGRDGHGEYFSPRTELYVQEGETRPVFYAHMETRDGVPQMMPVRIGTAKIAERDNQGQWADISLWPDVDGNAELWDAGQAGRVRVSAGTEDYAKRMTRNGEIFAWNIGEISLMDISTHLPANMNAIAYTKTLLSQTPKEPAEAESLPDSADEPQTDVAAVIPLLDYDTRLRE